VTILGNIADAKENRPLISWLWRCVGTIKEAKVGLTNRYTTPI